MIRSWLPFEELDEYLLRRQRESVAFLFGFEVLPDFQTPVPEHGNVLPNGVPLFDEVVVVVLVRSTVAHSCYLGPRHVPVPLQEFRGEPLHSLAYLQDAECCAPLVGS